MLLPLLRAKTGIVCSESSSSAVRTAWPRLTYQRSDGPVCHLASFSYKSPQSANWHAARSIGKKRNDTRGKRAGSEKVKRNCKAISRILDPAHDKGTNIASEISDRIDQRGAASRSGPTQEYRGKRPKRRSYAVDPGESERHRCERPKRAPEQSGSHKPNRTHHRRADPTPSTLPTTEPPSAGPVPFFPHGGDHERRRYVAQKLKLNARKGNTTLGGLTIVANLAVEELSQASRCQGNRK